MPHNMLVEAVSAVLQIGDTEFWSLKVTGETALSVKRSKFSALKKSYSLSVNV